MLILMVERFWGISRKDGKYRQRITGFRIRRCKIGQLPQIGKSEFYQFAVTEVGDREAVLELAVSKRASRKKIDDKIYLKRFVTTPYHTRSFDAGYKYSFTLI